MRSLSLLLSFLVVCAWAFAMGIRIVETGNLGGYVRDDYAMVQP